MGLRPTVGPGDEFVDLFPFLLGAGGAHGVGRAYYYRARERGRRLAAAHHELKSSGVGPEVQHYRLRVEPHAPGVAEPARVGSSEPELQVRGILVVWRDERAARYTRKVLHYVLVAVGRAVVHDQGPRQLGGSKRPLLRVGGRAGERYSVAHLPGGGGRWVVYGRRGRCVAGAYGKRLVEGVGCPLTVGDPEPHLVGSCGLVGVSRL